MSKTILSEKPGPIGIFDSGYGGLTILKHIQSAMPEYDFIYLGDNARTLTAPVPSRWCMNSPFSV